MKEYSIHNVEENDVWKGRMKEIKQIQNDVIYLTDILKEHNHKFTEVQYSFLNKGYWLLGENLDWYLGKNKEEAEWGLLKYIKSCK